MNTLPIPDSLALPADRRLALFLKWQFRLFLAGMGLFCMALLLILGLLQRDRIACMLYLQCLPCLFCFAAFHRSNVRPLEVLSAPVALLSPFFTWHLQAQSPSFYFSGCVLLWILGILSLLFCLGGFVFSLAKISYSQMLQKLGAFLIRLRVYTLIVPFAALFVCYVISYDEELSPVRWVDTLITWMRQMPWILVPVLLHCLFTLAFCLLLFFQMQRVIKQMLHPSTHLADCQQPDQETTEP